MKPLTIEQLKALEVGDWVWIDDGICKGYRKITRSGVYGMCLGESDSLNTFRYSDYDTRWVAYKNKEQAEAKGEIVELPCKIGDEAWFVVTKGKLSKIIETYVTKFQVTNDVIEVHFDKTIRTIKFHSNGTRENVYDIYLDKPEAERRLAELTKE